MPEAIKINHITVLVCDKNKAREFYCDILGFKKQGVEKSLWVRIGQQFIHISENSGLPVPNTFYHFAIEIENLDEYIETLKSKNVKVFDFDDNNNEIEINSKGEFNQYFVRDLDGNLIEFIKAGNKFFNPNI